MRRVSPVASPSGTGVTRLVAQHSNSRITRHAGYAVSQRIRMRIEGLFSWGEEVAGLRRMGSRVVLKLGSGVLHGAQRELAIGPA